MRFGAVAEARGDPCPEREGSADADHSPDQPVPGRLARLVDHGHEVLDLRHPVRGEEARDQHVRVGEVELPGAGRDLGGQLERPAPLGVEDGPEDAGRIEARAAVPVDGAVRADQGGRTEIADQAVLGDRYVAAAVRLLETSGVERHAGLPAAAARAWRVGLPPMLDRRPEPGGSASGRENGRGAAGPAGRGTGVASGGMRGRVGQLLGRAAAMVASMPARARSRPWVKRWLRAAPEPLACWDSTTSAFSVKRGSTCWTTPWTRW